MGDDWKRRYEENFWLYGPTIERIYHETTQENDEAAEQADLQEDGGSDARSEPAAYGDARWRASVM